MRAGALRPGGLNQKCDKRAGLESVGQGGSRRYIKFGKRNVDGADGRRSGCDSDWCGGNRYGGRLGKAARIKQRTTRMIGPREKEPVGKRQEQHKGTAEWLSGRLLTPLSNMWGQAHGDGQMMRVVGMMVESTSQEPGTSWRLFLF